MGGRPGRGERGGGAQAAAHTVPVLRRKSSEEAVRERQQVVSLAAMREPSLLRFYVSREWLNKFNTFAEPGPITNHTFLCSHGGGVPSGVGGRRAAGGRATLPLCLPPSPAGIPPNKYHYIDDLVVILPQNVWEHLYSRWGHSAAGGTGLPETAAAPCSDPRSSGAGSGAALP